MPYAMSLLSLEMLREYFDSNTETLGELVMNAKRRMSQTDGNEDPYRSMIEGLGKAFSPKPELLSAERREHLHLMHLIGDPLLRLKRPNRIEISAPARANAGAIIPVSGSMNQRSVLTVEVAYRRDRFRYRPPHRREYESTDQAFRAYQQAYENSHDLVCFRREIAVDQGDFLIHVPLPLDANGECIVSVFDSRSPNLSLGSAPIFINAVKRRTSSKRREPRTFK